MRLDAGSQNGTSQGKTKRIYEITIRLFESIGVEVGEHFITWKEYHLEHRLILWMKEYQHLQEIKL